MRIETQKIKVFNFNELSEDAKENARTKHSEFINQMEAFDFEIQDAKTIGAMMGIDIDNIYYSGFYSQGDGAQFTGSYSYEKGSLKKLKAHCPNENEILDIAKNLQAIQKKYFYQLTAKVVHSGHYQHENCTSIDVYRGLNDNDGFYSDEDAPNDVHNEITSLLRDFMRWIYSTLENQNEYVNSKEYIEKSITINEYEFLENGEIH